MAQPFRRAHARIKCDRPVGVMSGAASGRRLAEARMLNISIVGAYLRVALELKRATAYRLVLETPDGPLELPCRVARAGPAGPDGRHYGMVFNLTGDQERRLRGVLDFLARRAPTEQEARLDRTMRDYWSS
jgi:hypothetical protein